MEEPLNRSAQSHPESTDPLKPGRIWAIAIMTLVNGLLNCFLGLFWLILAVVCAAGSSDRSLATVAFMLGLASIGTYCVVVGIKELVYAAAILPASALVYRPARSLAVMEIVNLASGSLWSFITGILALIFYRDPDVNDWFRTRRREPTTNPGDTADGS